MLAANDMERQMAGAELLTHTKSVTGKMEQFGK